MANGNFVGGDGTENNPYLIEDAHDLNAVRNDLSAYYKLVNDIDLNIIPYNEGEGWTPIGSRSSRFEGFFDGNGNTIKNLFINRPNIDYQGLFGFVGISKTVKNIDLINVNVTAGDNTGGLIGGSFGSVKNVSSSGRVSGESRVGGLIGRLQYGDMRNAFSSASIIGSSTYSGGLIGSLRSPSSVSNAYSVGSVADIGIIGGLFGSSNGLVTNSYWDIETSGVIDSPHGIGLTTLEMKTKQTFVDGGWDTELTEDGIPVWKFHEVDGEDYPRLWFQPDWYKLRHFVKASEEIYTIDSNGSLITPQVSTVPTEQEFMEYGMKSLGGMFTPSSKVSKIASKTAELGSGATFSTKITPQEFSRQIKRIRNTR